MLSDGLWAVEAVLLILSGMREKGETNGDPVWPPRQSSGGGTQWAALPVLTGWDGRVRE